MLDGLESLSNEVTRPCARRPANLVHRATTQPRVMHRGIGSRDR
jgi:hypothetical protein